MANKRIYPNYPLDLLPAPCIRLIDIVARNTDAPLPMVATSALAVLSLLAGADVKAQGGLLLNNFYALIADTGVRKTTAARFAIKLVNLLLNVDPRPRKDTIILMPPDISFLTSFSIEGIEDQLVDSKNVLTVAGEYRTVFAKAARQTQKNTIPQLTEMYDCDPIKSRTRGENRVEISGYSLTLFATSTPAWFTEGLSQDNVLGGFLNRHLAILCPMPDQIIAMRQELDLTELEDLARDFLALDRRPRTINIQGKDEVGHFTSYSNEHWQRVKKAGEAERGVMIREPAHCLKLAGLKAFAEGRRYIDFDCLAFGEAWARASSQALLICTEKPPEIAMRPKSTEEKVLQFIIRKHSATGSPVTRRERAKHFGGEAAPLEAATRLLLEKGLIIETGDGFVPSEESTPKDMDATASPTGSAAAKPPESV